MAQVALFNWVKYSVCLAREYPGPRPDIQCGHFFNVMSNEILELEVRKRHPRRYGCRDGSPRSGPYC